MENNYLERKFILNPDYRLIDDRDRIILISDRSSRYFFHFIHPMHAILLSFFKGDKPMKETVREISDFFSIAKENVVKTITTFVNNPNDVAIEYDDTKFIFPKNMLVENKNNIIRQDIDYKLYMINPPYDFKRMRFSMPSAVVFVINTSCVTDCIYCYANRKEKYKPLSTEKILSIIEEAHKNGINDFDVSGGEIFLQKDWEIILEKLYNCGFTSNLSTKVPLSKKMVDKFVKTGFNRLT